MTTITMTPEEQQRDIAERSLPRYLESVAGLREVQALMAARAKHEALVARLAEIRTRVIDHTASCPCFSCYKRRANKHA